MKNLSKITTQFSLLVLALFTLTFTSCDDDEGAGPDGGEQEVITTVRLTFTAGGNSLVFNAVDADGDGGNAPIVDDISLAPNTTYALSVEFLDESDPADVEDITAEVAEEDLEHLVCFSASGIDAPTGLDTDSAGNTLGLTSTVVTTDAVTGTLQVSLKHEPVKDAAAPCTTGDTDAEVTFSVSVQ